VLVAAVTGALHTDCCDGSDEYDGKVKCPDTCYALGEDTRNAKRQEIEAFKKVWRELTSLLLLSYT